MLLEEEIHASKEGILILESEIEIHKIKTDLPADYSRRTKVDA